MDWLEKLALGVIIGIIANVSIAFVAVVSAVPTYFLWNWIMPEMFGLKTITFWQAWGIILLSGILFKSGILSKNSSSKSSP